MDKEVAILMVDLAGYTAMTDIHGGASAAKIVNQFMDLVDKSLYGNCKVIQRIGDQVVILSDDPVDLLITAHNIKSCADEQHEFLSIHAGIHYGPIHLEKGSLFGSTINIASRIMNLAQRGQILCSYSTVQTLSNDSPFDFHKIGKIKLKNVLQEVEIYELKTKSKLSTSMHFDPVCHMLLDPQKASYTFKLKSRTFHFCSLHCLELFKSHPEEFIQNHE